MLAEDAKYRHARVAYAEQMNLTRESRKVADALKGTDRTLKKAKQDIKHHDKVLVALTASRAYTVKMLGEGHKKGGTTQHAKNRRQVLEQVREVAELAPEQTHHWHLFKTAWDDAMVAFHPEKWAGVFAEIVQSLLKDLLAGKTDALSLFMENEKTRVLSNVPALVIHLPGSESSAAPDSH